MAANYNVITAAIPGDSRRSSVPQMTHGLQWACFLGSNFERASLRPLSVISCASGRASASANVGPSRPRPPQREEEPTERSPAPE